MEIDTDKVDNSFPSNSGQFKFNNNENENEN